MDPPSQAVQSTIKQETLQQKAMDTNKIRTKEPKAKIKYCIQESVFDKYWLTV